MNRRQFISIAGLSSAAMLFSKDAQARLLEGTAKYSHIKPITGSWIEFQHHYQ